MGRFIHHEPLAHGIFNRDYTSASGGMMQQWESELTNNGDCRLLQLLCDRMEVDWLALAPKMRKPYNVQQLDPRVQTI